VLLVIVFLKFFELFSLLLEHRLFNSEVKCTCLRIIERSSRDLSLLVHCLLSSGNRARAAVISITAHIKTECSRMGAGELSSPLRPAFGLAQVSSAIPGQSFSMFIFNRFVELMYSLYNSELL